MVFGKRKQAMAVCYSLNGGEIQFLLVKNKKGNRRTFPKGTIKKDEMPWLTAVREAYEEAGVLGEATHEPLTICPLMKRDEIRMVEAYLIRVGTTGLKHEKKRDPRWFTPEEAQEQLSLKRIPDDADELRRVVRLACRAIQHAPKTGHLSKPLTPPTQPIRVFVSYSHQDKKYLEKNSLLGYMSGLDSEGFEFWYDKRIAAGEMWDDIIRNEIKRTDIALLLVSQAFLNSAFCQNVEVRQFLDKRRKAGLIILPIILSPCDWPYYEWLARTQAIPGEGESISRNYIGEGKRYELFRKILIELREHGRAIKAKRMTYVAGGRA
jgi:8-oxo-dGTP pyrophosphatase MutT (NUDIX family)